LCYAWALMTSHAHEEEVRPRFSVITKEFLGAKETLAGLRCAEVEWKKDEQGRNAVPVEKVGTEFTVEADMAILAKRQEKTGGSHLNYWI